MLALHPGTKAGPPALWTRQESPRLPVMASSTARSPPPPLRLLMIHHTGETLLGPSGLLLAGRVHRTPTQALCSGSLCSSGVCQQIKTR